MAYAEVLAAAGQATFGPQGAQARALGLVRL